MSASRPTVLRMVLIAMAEAACRHCTTEQIIDLVLSSAHERLRVRCDRSKIIDVLEEKHGAYDVHAVCLLLARKYDGVEEQLESAGAAPPAFLAALWPLVQPPESTAAAAEEAGGAGPSEQPPPSEPPPSKPKTSACSKQASPGSFFLHSTKLYFTAVRYHQPVSVLAPVPAALPAPVARASASRSRTCQDGRGAPGR